MPPQSVDRREFLRRASLSAGALGLAGSAASVAGCGDSGTGPPPMRSRSRRPKSN
jgi:hypothetical protein